MEEFFSRDLTQLAKCGKLGPFFGRGATIKQAISVLSQDRKASVVFTGEPGVGKTAVVEALCLCLADGSTLDTAHPIQVKELDTNSLVSGTIYHGQFEARTKDFVQYLRANPEIVVFVDEIHTLLSVSSDENRTSPFANFLKPFLARGEIRMIGASTNREFDAMSRKDPALARRFVRIDVPEPTKEESISILRQLDVQRLSSAAISMEPMAIEAIVDASIKHMHDRRLPDKAIELFNACVARATTRGASKSATSSMQSFDDLLKQIEDEAHAIENEDWTTAARISREWLERKGLQTDRITVGDVQSVVRERFGGLDAQDNSTIRKILNLDEQLRSGLIGQRWAIEAVCAALKRMIALGQSGRPIGSFLFLGPTGVGKTELCKVVADRLWGTGSLLQYNMSEYMERVDVTKLIGSAPGYVGSEEGGRLIRDVSAKPSSVVLFDEIEKAHPDIHNLLLQMLEEGRLQDSCGQSCSFSQSLVMLTSNLCSDLISTLTAEDIANDYERIRAKFTELLKREIRPEIINRIDEIVIFAPLSRSDLSQILDILIAKENARLKQNGRPPFELTPAAHSEVLNRGFNPSMGARPLRRQLEQLVLTKVADYILAHSLSSICLEQSSLVVDWSGQDFQVELQHK